MHPCERLPLSQMPQTLGEWPVAPATGVGVCATIQEGVSDILVSIFRRQGQRCPPEGVSDIGIRANAIAPGGAANTWGGHRFSTPRMHRRPSGGY